MSGACLPRTADAGAVMAGNFILQKARILLMLLRQDGKTGQEELQLRQIPLAARSADRSAKPSSVFLLIPPAPAELGGQTYPLTARPCIAAAGALQVPRQTVAGLSVAGGYLRQTKSLRRYRFCRRTAPRKRRNLPGWGS